NAARHLDRAALGQGVGADVDPIVGQIGADARIKRHSLGGGGGDGTAQRGDAADEHGRECAAAIHQSLPGILLCDDLTSADAMPSRGLLCSRQEFCAAEGLGSNGKSGDADTRVIGDETMPAALKPWPAAFAGRQMAVSGGTQYVRVGGRGPAVLLL